MTKIPNDIMQCHIGKGTTEKWIDKLDRQRQESQRETLSFTSSGAQASLCALNVLRRTTGRTHDIASSWACIRWPFGKREEPSVQKHYGGPAQGAPRRIRLCRTSLGEHRPRFLESWWTSVAAGEAAVSLTSTSPNTL